MVSLDGTASRNSDITSKLRFALVAFLIVLCLGSIAVGIYSRTNIYLKSDPIAVTGDLISVQDAWTDLNGPGLSGRPSIRINQYGLAIILGLLAETWTENFADAAALLAYVCSIGIIGVAAWVMYAVGGGWFERLAIAVIVAVSPSVIANTLKAKSESPSIFFTLLGIAALTLFWRKGRKAWLVPSIFALAISQSIRGTGMLHTVALAVALTLVFVAQKPQLRPQLSRLVLVWSVLLISTALYQMGLAAVKHQTAQTYIERDGKAPEFRSYTTYAVYDGILSGPYGTESKEIVSKMQEIKKGIDPKTGKRYPNPVEMGESATQVIWQHRGVFLKNLFAGIGQTFVKFVTDPMFNLVGFWPLALGAVVLCMKRNRLAFFVIGSWVFVYIVFVSAILVHNRTVWPGSIGLCFISAFFFGYLGREVVSPRLVRGAMSTLSVAIILGWVVLYSASDALGQSKKIHRDPRAHAARLMQADGVNPIRLLTCEAGFLSFREGIEYNQMLYNVEETIHRDRILRTKPDYVFFYGAYRGTWGKDFETIRRILASMPDTVHVERIWQEGAHELYRLRYSEQKE